MDSQATHKSCGGLFHDTKNPLYIIYPVAVCYFSPSIQISHLPELVDLVDLVGADAVIFFIIVIVITHAIVLVKL